MQISHIPSVRLSGCVVSGSDDVIILLFVSVEQTIFFWLFDNVVDVDTFSAVDFVDIDIDDMTVVDANRVGFGCSLLHRF